MKKLRSTRSQQYQYKICEINVPIETMCSYTEDRALGYGLFDLSGEAKDKYLDLVDALYDRIKTLYYPLLTDLQRQIVEMWLGGATQQEIADKYNVHQSSIQKTLFGTAYFFVKNGKKYFPRKSKLKYGGAFKKLKILCEKDDVIKNILKNIHELHENKQ